MKVNVVPDKMTTRTYIVDGNEFTTLAEFSAVFSKTVLSGHTWNGNLDAFNDILRGGFGTPDGGFTLVWKHSSKSRRDLGYPETARWYEAHIKTCHPANVERLQKEFESVQRSEGETVFDWLIQIIRNHGPGGTEAEDGVILKLE